MRLIKLIFFLVSNLFDDVVALLVCLALGISIANAQANQANFGTNIPATIVTTIFSGSIDSKITQGAAALAAGGNVNAQGEACGQTFAAAVSLSNNYLNLIMPLCAPTNPTLLGTLGQITMSGTNDSVTCPIYFQCALNASANGSLSAIKMLGNFARVSGIYIQGGRKALQTGTELIFGQATATLTNFTADHNWIKDSGGSGISSNNCGPGCVITDNIIEKAFGAGISYGANAGTYDGIIERNQIYDSQLGQITGIAQLDITSTGGYAAGSRIAVKGNIIRNGGFGPSYIHTANGAAVSLVNVSNASPTVTWNAGDCFQSVWNNPIATHARIGGVDYMVSTVGTPGCAGGSLTLATNYSLPTGQPTSAVPAVFYFVPDYPMWQQCGGINSSGSVTVSSGTTLTLPNGVGSGNAYGYGASGTGNGCNFLTTWSNVPVIINGIADTITSCVSTTQCTLGTTFANGTYNTWNEYITPSDLDTGNGEGIQLSAKNYGVQLVENNLFNIADEGIVFGNQDNQAVGNYVEDPAQGCTGCGGFIQSAQSGASVQGFIGPFHIASNFVVAASSGGVPATGFTGFNNANGTVNYGFWGHVSSASNTPGTYKDGNISGNLFTKQGNGSLNYGIELTNDSSAVWPISNVVICGNTFDASQVWKFTNTNFQGVPTGCDVPGFFFSGTGATPGPALSQNAVLLWGYITNSATTCDDLYFTVNTADNSADVYDFVVYTGAGGQTGTLVCHTGSVAGSAINSGGTGNTHLAIGAGTIGAGAYIPQGTKIYFGYTSNAASPLLKLAVTPSSAGAGQGFSFLTGTNSVAGVGGATAPATIALPADNPAGIGSVANLGIY